MSSRELPAAASCSPAGCIQPRFLVRAQQLWCHRAGGSRPFPVPLSRPGVTLRALMGSSGRCCARWVCLSVSVSPRDVLRALAKALLTASSWQGAEKGANPASRSPRACFGAFLWPLTGWAIPGPSWCCGVGVATLWGPCCAPSAWRGALGGRGGRAPPGLSIFSPQPARSGSEGCCSGLLLICLGP